MKRIAIGIVIALLYIGLVPARSESAGTKPERRVTLLLQTPARDSWEKATVSFQPKEIYDGSKEPHNEWDLLYGGLSYKGDANWLKVNCDRHSWSRIRDLGEMDFKNTPAFPNSRKPRKPLPLSGRVKEINSSAGSTEISPYQQFVPVKAGHIYLMKVVRERKKTYVMFRVDNLVSEDNCRLSWKKVAPPPADIEQ